MSSQRPREQSSVPRSCGAPVTFGGSTSAGGSTEELSDAATVRPSAVTSQTSSVPTSGLPTASVAPVPAGTASRSQR